MTALWVLAPVLLPALAAGACLLLRHRPVMPRVALAGAGLGAGAALALAVRAVGGGPFVTAAGWLHADGLSALVSVIGGGVLVATLVHARSYLAVLPALEPGDGGWAPGRWEATMLGLAACVQLSAVANNLGLLWIALEGATLASAVLVGYYRRTDALEAAWKYLLLCSVGIALALFATVLLHYAAVSRIGAVGGRLEWTTLRDAAAALDPRFVRLAFLFALVGWGAKIGLAPMHAWVPDAYGRAPAPASALLSTAVTAAGVAALLRYATVARTALGPEWPERWLALFGVASVVVAVPFLVAQSEYKRLLAWSSVKHTGLVVLAAGLGTPLALFGGLLHLLSQSAAKSLGFMLGGHLLRASGSHRLDHCQGVLAADRGLGTLLLVTGIGLTGLPPSATFLSQWLTLAGGFTGPRPVFAAIALVALAAGFLGLVFHWVCMLTGPAREGFADAMPRSARAPLWAMAAVLVALGLWLPAPVRALLESAVQAVRP